MITPRFSCAQTDESVVISIYCPSVRASEVEIHVDENFFSVHIAPYFLRLTLPHNVLEDDSSSARYDPSSGYLTVTLTKEVKGQDFPDLDLLAKLLAPKPVHPAHPVIEVLSSQEGTDGGEEELINQTQSLTLDETRLTDEQREILEAAANDWQLPQTVPEPLPVLHTSLEKPYGFLNMYQGYFRHVTTTENEVNELDTDAETLPVVERQRRRISHEDEKWDEEHYMADYADGEYIDELIAWEHPLLATHDVAPFSEDENMTMLRLPQKEYIANPAQTHSLYLTLVTILFSYAYDARTTQHDPTPESAWTISVLTPCFTALDHPPYRNVTARPPTPDHAPHSIPHHATTSSDIDFIMASASSRSLRTASFSTPESSQSFPPSVLSNALIPSYRRCLSFPLYRSWALAERCRRDVAGFLKRGTRAAMRVLLEIRAILDKHEAYYVYSRIWVDDMCTWVARYAADEKLRQLGKALDDLKMNKGTLEWDLEALEAAVQAAQERGSDSDDESEDEVERMVPAQLS